MEEKIIIKSKHYKVAYKMWLLIAIGMVVVGVALFALNAGACRVATNIYGKPYNRDFFYYFPTFWFWWDVIPVGFILGLLIDLGILIFIFSTIVRWWLSSYSMTVTDKRICGKVAFGKRADLPLDSISAISMSALKGITVATSSGRIVFKLVKNRDEIHTALSNLLIDRQTKAAAVKSAPQSNAEELKKYKELLDCGVISQAEFDAKKKQLLGL